MRLLNYLRDPGDLADHLLNLRAHFEQMIELLKQSTGTCVPWDLRPSSDGFPSLDDGLAANQRYGTAGVAHDCVLSDRGRLRDDDALYGRPALNARVMKENRIASHGSICDLDARA